MRFGSAITGVNTLAERLTAAREAAGLTQGELAARAGVSQGTIGNAESGLRRQPRGLVAIAAALNVRPEWLLSGKGAQLASAPQVANIIPMPAAPDCIKPLADKLAAMDDDARAIAIGAFVGWLQRGAPATSIEQLRRLLGEFSPPAADHKLAGNGAK